MKYRIEPNLYLETKGKPYIALNREWFNDFSVSYEEKGIIGTAVCLKIQGFLLEPFKLDEFTELLSANLPEGLQELREIVECAISHGFIKEESNGKN